MIAGKWGDAIVGVDIHWVLVPAPPAPAPVPTPLPHPFTGVVFDPMGLAIGTAISAGISLVTGSPITGPVLINGSPAANTGTEGTNKMVMPHIPTPPGVGWAPVPAGLKPPIPGKPPDPGVPTPVPSNDAIIVTGSKTVHINGTNASRLGDLAMSCGEPIRLPSSAVVAVPMGPPVLIGGPPTLDFMAAAMGAIRTSWVSGRLTSVVNRVFGEGSRAARWLNRAVCFLTGHPVDISTGSVFTAFTDLDLPGPVPLRLDRIYASAFADRSGPFGRGWSSSLHPALWQTHDAAVLRTEDGREVAFPGAGAAAGFTGHAVDHRHDADRLVLRRTSDRTWRLTDAHGVVTDLELHDACGAAVPVRRSRDGFAIDFAYDDAGRLVRVADTAGRRVDLGNDERGRITSLAVDGRTIRGFAYDDHDHLVEVTDGMGATWRFDYVDGLLVQETDRTGHAFCFAYDGLGADARCVRTWGEDGAFDRVLKRDEANGITLVSDAHDATTLYTTDEHGRVVKIQDPLGQSVELAWDATNRCVRRVDANGTAHDLAGTADAARLTGALTRTGEAALLGRASAVDEPGARGIAQARTANWGRIGLDPAGRVLAAESARGRAFRYTRDAWGRRLAVHDAEGELERRDYDGEGRLLRIDSGGCTIWEGAWDAEGRLVGGRAGSLRRTFDYWCARHVETATTGDRVVHYAHDNEGRITGRTDSEGRRWSFAYDARGDVERYTDPDGHVVRIARDAGGRVTAWRFADGSERRLTWDDDDRLVEIAQPDGESHAFAHDDHGLLAAATTDACEVAIERDGRGRIVRETQGDAWVESEYDERGFRTLLRTSLGATIAFRRDAAGELAAIEARAGDHAWTGRFTRDRTGTSQVWDLAGGVRIEAERTRTGRLVSRRVVVADRVARDERLEWTDRGELAAVHEGGATVRTSDDGGRAVNTRTTPEGEDVRSADAFGNVSAGEADARTYSPNGALLRMGDTTFEYDAHGRRIRSTAADGAVRTFEWNGADLLAAIVDEDGTRVEFGYDAFARRVWRREGDRVTRWLWSGDVVVHEWQERADGTTTRPALWVHHPDLPQLLADLGGEARTIVNDVRGNPVLGVGPDGRVRWSREADVWGRIIEATGDAESCTTRGPGQVEDATGLFYNRWRWYDPHAGVFLSPDPVLDVASTSPYAHVRSILWSMDPLGLAHEAQAWVVDESGRPVIGDDGRPVTVERPRYDPTRPLDDPYSHRYNGNLGHEGHSEPGILRAAQDDARVMSALEQPGTRLRIVSQGSGVDRGTRTAAAHKGPRSSCPTCQTALQEFADDVGERLGRQGDELVEYFGEDLKKPAVYRCGG